jgi:hypothetical protein
MLMFAFDPPKANTEEDSRGDRDRIGSDPPDLNTKFLLRSL